MIPLSTDDPNVTFTRFVREWFCLLAHGAYRDALSKLDEPSSSGKYWGREEIQEALRACSRCASTEVTDPNTMLGDGNPHIMELEGSHGYFFQQEIPMDGEWS